MSLNRLALCLTIAICASSAAGAADSTLFFAGTSLDNNSSYTYAGGVYAINNNLNSDGWLIRGTAAYGDYEYNKTTAEIDGDTVAADAMIGYQKLFADNNPMVDTRISGYLGVDYQNHDLTLLTQQTRLEDLILASKGRLRGC